MRVKDLSVCLPSSSSYKVSTRNFQRDIYMPFNLLPLHSQQHHHPIPHLTRSRLRKQAACTSIQSDTRRLSLPMSRLFNSTQMMLLSIMVRDSRLATLIDMVKPSLPMSKLFN